MLDLGSLHSDRDRLAWHLKWGRFIAPDKGVVYQKDGSYTRSFEFRGKDLDSTDDDEFLHAVESLNGYLAMFGKRWTLHFEYRNFDAAPYPERNIKNPAARLVDEERREMLGSQGVLAEQKYFLTITYDPPPKTVLKLQKTFQKKRVDEETLSVWQSEIEPFIRATDLFAGTMDQHLDFCRGMNDDETLTYYAWCLDVERIEMKMPKCAGWPICNVAVGSPIVPGSFPSFIGYNDSPEKSLGECDSTEIHIRCVSVRGYPEVTYPDLLGGLSNLTTEDGHVIPFRFVQRFVCLSPEEMENEMRDRYEKRKNNQYNVKDYFWRVVSKKIVIEPDPTAVAAQMVARKSLEESAMEGGDVTMAGYLTPVVVVWDKSVTRVDEKVRKIREFFKGCGPGGGFKCEVETINSMRAFMSTIPGEHKVNIRMDPLPAIHLVHCIPVSAVWPGPDRSEFLTKKLKRNVPPALQLTTNGRTPFRWDNWCGDNMNTLLVAPPRTGKSTFMAVVGMAVQQDPNARIFSLDVDGEKSAIIPACLASGGEVLTFREGEAAMQPLSDLESHEGRDYARSFLSLCARAQKVYEGLSPTKVSQGVNAVLSILSEEPGFRRTMKQASKLAQYDELREAWAEYGEDGPWGRLTGGHRDVLGEAHWVTFELSNIVNKGPEAAPGMDCLFHKLESRCEEGRQTLIQADEAWLLLRIFPEKLDEYLRRLPKKHAGLMLAIHNLHDLGDLAPMFRDSCKQKIFLANPNATTKEGLEVLSAFNMGRQQAELIAHATPKQDLYVVTDEGSRLAHLRLPPVSRVLCASGGPENAARIRRLLSQGKNNFGARLLRDHGMYAAAEKLEVFYGDFDVKAAE